jgi:hypothetical protein
MRRAASGHLPLAPADDRARAPCPAGRTAGTGPAATVPPYMNTVVTVHNMAPRPSAAGLAGQMVFS